MSQPTFLPNGSVLTGADPKEAPATPPAPPVDDPIARARQQEKDKLYPQIESQRERIERLEAELAARNTKEQELLQAEEKARLEAEADARKKAEQEMDLRSLWEQKEQELRSELDNIRAEAARKEALLAREQELRDLIEYREAAKREHGDAIIPELRDLVDGGSREEIDASIARLAEKSQSILEMAQEAAVQARALQRGVSPTGSPFGAAPLDTHASNTPFSAGDIAGMSMNDYIRNRDKLMQQSRSDRGLFG